MTNVIDPTVARMVWFKAQDTPESPLVNRAAIITDVHSQNEISLCVLHPTEMTFERNVQYGEELGQWDWMPYQKGQAKKTEELEKKVAEPRQDDVAEVSKGEATTEPPVPTTA